MERSELRSRNRELRKTKKRLEESRTNWKSKSISKGLTVNKLDAKINKRTNKASKHHYELWIVSLCVALRLEGKCSYRGVRRIIEILNVYFDLGMRRIPCPNSIENWVSKLGLFYYLYIQG